MRRFRLLQRVGRFTASTVFSLFFAKHCILFRFFIINIEKRG